MAETFNIFDVFLSATMRFNILSKTVVYFKRLNCINLLLLNVKMSFYLNGKNAIKAD